MYALLNCGLLIQVVYQHIFGLIYSKIPRGRLFLLKNVNNLVNFVCEFFEYVEHECIDKLPNSDVQQYDNYTRGSAR